MAGRFNPPPLGPYQYHEVLSALRKEIKIGNVEEAIYWANVIQTKSENGATGQRTLAKQLWIMATEDCYGTEVIMRCFVFMQTAGKVAETDHGLFLTAFMCRAPKWWESEEGRAVDIAWAKAIGDLKDPERQHEIPSYALDRHTRRGWSVLKRMGDFDDRYTGTDLGRQQTVFLFLRDGVLDPAINRLDKKNDEAFKRHWNWFRNLMRVKKADLEPNDPLGEEGLLPPVRAGGGEALFDPEDAGGPPLPEPDTHTGIREDTDIAAGPHMEDSRPV